MKVAIITDQHFGGRNDSLHFLDYYDKFYTETFFPVIDENNITTVLILGDTFDRRKYINFYSLKRAKEMFFDPLRKRGINVQMLAGNHDTYFKNTNNVNSIDLLLGEYDNINVIHSPKTIYVDPVHICMVPWICAENYNDSMKEIENTQADICMGHFEIEGFVMHRGAICEDGLNRNIFKHFDTVFSGHYHHKSKQNNIQYLGNPYEMTWIDYGDERGFHLFDLKTKELEFIKNPNVMFHKIKYNDKSETITQITGKDLTKYTNKYVKVIVENKTNPHLFDRFLNNLYDVNPIDINIVEDFTENFETTLDEVDQAEDTITIINKYIDGMSSDNIDNSKLKNVMRRLYVEALNTEQV